MRKGAESWPDLLRIRPSCTHRSHHPPNPDRAHHHRRATGSVRTAGRLVSSMVEEGHPDAVQGLTGVRGRAPVTPAGPPPFRAQIRWAWKRWSLLARVGRFGCAPRWALVLAPLWSRTGLANRRTDFNWPARRAGADAGVVSQSAPFAAWKRCPGRRSAVFRRECLLARRTERGGSRPKQSTRPWTGARPLPTSWVW